MVEQLIGTLYFTADRDKDGKPTSRYQGVISGIIVRRDDGSEFTVRSESPLPYSKVPLKKQDLDNIRVGDELQSMADNTRYTVLRVFPTYGDIWVKDLEGKTHAKKYTDLRRAL